MIFKDLAKINKKDKDKTTVIVAKPLARLFDRF
jgi:hypothetical protein